MKPEVGELVYFIVKDPDQTLFNVGIITQINRTEKTYAVYWFCSPLKQTVVISIRRYRQGSIQLKYQKPK